MEATAALGASDLAVWSYFLAASLLPQIAFGQSERRSNQSCASGHGSNAAKHEGPSSIQVKSQRTQNLSIYCRLSFRTQRGSLFPALEHMNLSTLFTRWQHLPSPFLQAFYFEIIIDLQEVANLDQRKPVYPYPVISLSGYMLHKHCAQDLTLAQCKNIVLHRFIHIGRFV